MFEEQLEFRGIILKELLAYAAQLKGIQVTDNFPFIFEGDNWKIKIMEAQTVRITSTFYVNAVFVKFSAESEEKLTEIIRNYRKKTMRAGG